MHPRRALLPIVLALLPAHRADPAPLSSNAAWIDDQGNTHVTRVVPVPDTISAEAQAKLTHPPPSILSAGTVAEQRTKMDARQARDAVTCLTFYPAIISEERIADIPVRVVTPRDVPAWPDRVLINLHGGAFHVDAGSLLESIPIAALTRTKVVSVLYRLAPEHPFPAAVNDAVAVYRALLRSYPSSKIGIYGTSAGAILTAETAVKIKTSGLPMPAALGIFSGWGDFSRRGDSLALFGLQGLTGTLLGGGSGPLLPDYVGPTPPRDPVLSPVYADLHGLPPTLFLTSTRDLLLSGTVVLHQAFLRAGVDGRMMVFDALPHAFWLDPQLPESRNVNEAIARFFDGRLGGK